MPALAYMGCVDALDPDAAQLLWLDDTDRVVIGGARELAIEQVSSGAIEARLCDSQVSASHAVLDRQGRKWRLRDCASRNGTLVDGRRVAEHVLLPGEIIETGNTFWRYLEYCPLQPSIFSREAFAPMGPTRTVCPALLESMSVLGRAALSKNHVVILGDTGTGKEAVTDQIHAWSRRTGSCIRVNCAGLKAERASGELFGWQRGAFTGADRDHAGHFEEANRGTLFLDEIGTLSLEVQGMLLRVVEDGRVTRLGDARTRPVDVRIVSATNSDLPSMLKPGKFREDLYARLAQYVMDLPPLRERREDLCTLVAYHLRNAGATLAMDPAAMWLLVAQDWQLNIRGLNSALDGATLVSGGKGLMAEHFDLPPAPQAAPPESDDAVRDEARQQEHDRLDQLLTEHLGNVSAVARALGVHPNQVYRDMEKHGIDPASYRRLRRNP